MGFTDDLIKEIEEYDEKHQSKKKKKHIEEINQEKIFREFCNNISKDKKNINYFEL